MSVHANIVEHMTSNTLRMSTMFLRTLREDPADADVDSAKLLQRAGYIRKAAPGIWTRSRPSTATSSVRAPA